MTPVVVPIYKQTPSADELVSLRQCFKVLGIYHIIFVVPSGLDLTEYFRVGTPHRVISYDASFFLSLDDYNRLLKSEVFYAAFIDYEYMLIYQLDCFVFRDELNEWCESGYSYIGPPWLNYDFLQQTHNPLSHFPFVKHCLAKVGNGGFSLRDVSLHYKLAKKYAWLAGLFRVNEDLFWCSIIGRLEKQYVLPDADTALHFAFEQEPARSFAMCGDRLPFGCHAWKKYDAAFWSKYITSP